MLHIRQATESDRAAILALLEADGLRPEGVLEDGTQYWLAVDDGRPIGAIGLELGKGCVLLRSAIVHPHERGRGLGRRLTDAAVTWAWENGYGTVYLFSTDAGSYWTARGFALCPVDEVVQALPDAPQVELFDRMGWLPGEVAYRMRREQTDATGQTA